MTWLRALLAIALRTPGSSVRVVTRLLAGRSDNENMAEISIIISMPISAVGPTKFLSVSVPALDPTSYFQCL